MTDISLGKTFVVCVSVATLATGMFGLSAARAGPLEVAWTYPGHGAFQTGAHWAGGVPPGATTKAVFAQSSSNTVTFVANAMNPGVVARGGARPTLDLAGRTYSLSGLSSVVVGENGGDSASLTLRGGELTGFNVEIGRLDGAEGALVVTGAATTLSAALDLFVARGEGASGTLSVAGGAEVTTRSTYFGYEDDSVSAGEVRGGGSSLICSQDLVIGQFGEALLDVRAGGFVSAQNIASGRSSSSSGALLIRGPESELFTLFKLSIGSGFGATAQFEVSDGARARSLFGVLAEIQASQGDAEVTGAGSHWDVDDALYVGFRGEGFLRIADGARVDSKFSVIGRYTGGGGEVRVEGPGSLWVNEQHIEVGAAGDRPCSLVVEAGATVRSGSVVVRASGTLGGAGVVESAVEITGVHRPGPLNAVAGATGTSVVVGAYTLKPSGALELDVSGLTPGAEHDVLTVVGEAEIAGSLRLVWDEAFDPPIGASMTVMSALGMSGWFSAVEAPELVWPKRLIVERVGETVAVRVGVRRLSEFGSLFPEGDSRPWGERVGGANGAGGALRAFKEWAEAASTDDICAGEFQPTLQIRPAEPVSGR